LTYRKLSISIDGEMIMMNDKAGDIA